jgi:flagellar biosynthesis/type III secretory pathway M-ring protein FliF/YscJ
LYKFDLNNDSVEDLLVSYNGINSTSRKANLFIQEIVFSKESANQTSNNLNEDSSLIKTKDTSIFWILSFVLLVVILFFVYTKFYPLYKRHKRKHYFPKP